MNVVTPKCPSCGAELSLEGGGLPSRCKFCGKDVVDVDAPSSASGNLVTLARAAAEAGNDTEAATLWSRTLESDPANVEAWLGKAKAIPMTLATMQRGYEQAESYAKRAIEASGGSKDTKSSAFGILAAHLMTMTMAARGHFEEFWEVDGAAAEHVGQMFDILDAYDRLADLTGSNVAHVQAVEACDWLLAGVFGKVPALRADIEARRREHVRKSGPLLAGESDTPEKGRTSTMSLRTGARIGLGVAALATVVLSAIGWSRWAGANPELATTTPTSEATPSMPSMPPAPTTPVPQAAGSRALGFPQTVSFPGDSTWTILEVVDRGSVLVAVKGGKQAQTTSGRWLVVHFEATNDGTTTASSSPDPRIVDSKGRSIELWSEDSYDNYLRGTVRVLGTEDVKPGLKKDYWAIYEVPPGPPLKLRLHAMQGKGIRDLDLRFEGDPVPASTASAVAKPKPASKTWAKGNLEVCSQQCVAECGEPGGTCNRDCMMAHCY